MTRRVFMGLVVAVGLVAPAAAQAAPPVAPIYVPMPSSPSCMEKVEDAGGYADQAEFDAQVSACETGPVRQITGSAEDAIGPLVATFVLLLGGIFVVGFVTEFIRKVAR